ncbi:MULTISPECIES: hypothetical protein [unclassified Streptomyces]|uniref:hypothetical protein n=1 Tax=unclassified Streptomyces TaxID=2593676 RepID=UPI000DDB378D|nr:MULTISPECIES: hypothetical protein [unclassified Streptomyces]QZZ25469.1 hypothetical protein A7X85_03470 [Streptomyces sp. ST1015]
MAQDDDVINDSLTPQERAFLGSSGEPRGYTPFDALPEPEQPPTGPAGASTASQMAGSGEDESGTGGASAL